MCTREADGARLVGNGSGDCLANPPRGVGGKLVAAAVVELIHSLHQADVALLDQVEELKPAVGVLLGHRHHKAQVGFDELVFGPCNRFNLNQLQTTNFNRFP